LTEFDTDHPVPNVNPQGTFSADSVGFLLNGQRFYPISGEIHLARVPSSQWREELMRMKAGGLNAVAVYVFWIHHEETEGVWNFTGRRHIKEFFQHVDDLGMLALLRAGPWDHGECRNGGHPDWLLEKAKTEGFALRQNNTNYVS
jgi:beta-galactosidase GanA